MRLELEFENYDEEKNDVMDVQIIKKKTQSMKRNLLYKQDEYFTSAHIKAGRKIAL